MLLLNDLDQFLILRNMFFIQVVFQHRQVNPNQVLLTSSFKATLVAAKTFHIFVYPIDQKRKTSMRY